MLWLYSPLTMMNASAPRIDVASRSRTSGGLALVVFLVHLFQQGELLLQRVDQCRLVPAPSTGLDEELRRLDALAVRSDGPVDDEQLECVGHESFPFIEIDFEAPEAL